MEEFNRIVDRLEVVNRVNNVREMRRRRRVLDRQDPLTFYDDEEFRKRYRLTKGTVRFVTELLKDDLEPETRNSQNISVELMVLTTLRYYAKGCFQTDNGKNVVKLSIL